MSKIEQYFKALAGMLDFSISNYSKLKNDIDILSKPKDPPVTAAEIDAILTSVSKLSSSDVALTAKFEEIKRMCSSMTLNEHKQFFTLEHKMKSQKEIYNSIMNTLLDIRNESTRKDITYEGTCTSRKRSSKTANKS